MSSTPVIISVEGNIGTGKTTLLEHLKKHYENSSEVMFLEEPVDVWESVCDEQNKNIIERFYEHSTTFPDTYNPYAFQFQVMAYNTIYSQLVTAIAENPSVKVIITERSIQASANVFAKMMSDTGIMSKMEYTIYQMMIGNTIQNMKLNGIILLDTSAVVCQKRIQKRSRKGETMSIDYLNALRSYNNEFIENEPCTLLRLNVTPDVTYCGEQDMGTIWIKQIESFVAHYCNSELAEPRLIIIDK